MMERNRHGGRTWAARLGLLSGSIAGAFLIAECVVRVFNLGPVTMPMFKDNFRLSPNPVLRYALLPGSADGTNTINRDGMRDRDYLRKKPDHTYRIACVGDSICFGYGVESCQSLPKQLETLLGRCAPGRTRYEVLNFGVVGYNTVQVVETVRTKVLDYEPDLIIYLYCLNDPQAYCFEMEELLAQLSPAQRNYLNLEGKRRSLIHSSRIFRDLAYAIQRHHEEPTSGRKLVWDRDDPQGAAMNQNAHVPYFVWLHKDSTNWAPVGKALDKLTAMTRARSIPVVVAIVPLFMELEGNEYRLRDVHRFVAAEATARHLRVLDLYKPCRVYKEAGLTSVMLDALHFSKEGNAYVAQALLAYLLHDDTLPERTELAKGLRRDAQTNLCYAPLSRLFPEVMGKAGQP